jgi:hypothetical protein
MEESSKDKEPSLEDYIFLKEYEDVFWEFPRFPPNRDIYFSIDLIPRVSPMSKTPYEMSTPKVKKLQMQLEELLKKGCIFLSAFCEE